ncbi:hypothetical protein GGI05_003220, partial [Coemansia sp. RSA 2603]
MLPYHKSEDSYLQVTQNAANIVPGPQPYRHSYNLPDRPAVEQPVQNTSAPSGSRRQQYVYPEIAPTAIAAGIPPPLANAATMPVDYQNGYLGAVAKTYPPNSYNYQQLQQPPTYAPGPQQLPALHQQQQQLGQMQGYKFQHQPQLLHNGHIRHPETQSAPISPTHGGRQQQGYQLHQYIGGMTNGVPRPHGYGYGGGSNSSHGHQTPQPPIQQLQPAAPMAQVHSPTSAPAHTQAAPAHTQAAPAIPMPVPIPEDQQNPYTYHNQLNPHRYHQGYYSSNNQSPQSHSHSPQNPAYYHVSGHHHTSQQSNHSRPQSRPHSRPHSRTHSPLGQQRLHKASMNGGSGQVSGGSVSNGNLSNAQQQLQQQTQARWQQVRPPVDVNDFAQNRTYVAYLRNGARSVERSKFTTLMHCLEPVNLVDKISNSSGVSSSLPPKGNLYPLYKASEDWIAP